MTDEAIRTASNNAVDLHTASRRFRDFDAALEESDGEPVRWRMRGRDYELPADFPAKPVFRFVRAGNLEDPTANFAVLEEIVGTEQMNQMLEDGMGVKQLRQFFAWLFKAYGLEEFGVGYSEPVNGATPPK